MWGIEFFAFDAHSALCEEEEELPVGSHRAADDER